MSEIMQELPQAATFPFPNLSAARGRLHRVLCRALMRSRTRRVVADLSEAQLRDAGIDRSTVLGAKPMIAVEARVTTYLISLR